MILGGGREKIPVEKVIGQTDDSVKLEELTEHLRNACRNDFEGWGTEALGEGLLCDWTGIMGFTQDSGSLFLITRTLHDACGRRTIRRSHSRKTWGFHCCWTLWAWYETGFIIQLVAYPVKAWQEP
jgi:hypothetical protein